MSVKNEHLVPQLVTDLVENKDKPWKTSQQRDIEYARLIAIRDYIDAALKKVAS